MYISWIGTCIFHEFIYVYFMNLYIYISWICICIFHEFVYVYFMNWYMYISWICICIFHDFVYVYFMTLYMYISCVYPNLPEEGCQQSFLSLLRERALCALYLYRSLDSKDYSLLFSLHNWVESVTNPEQD